MANSTEDIGKKPTFRTHAALEFYTDDYVQYRANIVSINEGRPMVTLQKFHYDEQKADWMPTKKVIFMKKEAFNAMVKRAAEIQGMANAHIPGVLTIELDCLFTLVYSYVFILHLHISHLFPLSTHRWQHCIKASYLSTTIRC